MFFQKARLIAQFQRLIDVQGKVIEAQTEQIQALEKHGDLLKERADLKEQVHQVELDEAFRQGRKSMVDEMDRVARDRIRNRCVLGSSSDGGGYEG